MKTLYLHIGMPKTGTTYIQNFLRKNNDVLKSNGYIYPDFGVRFDTIGANRNGHFLINIQKDKDGKRNNKTENYIENSCMKELIELSELFPNIILSEESLWNSAERKRDKDFWKNLRSKLNERGIELKVIVYLRRQDLFIQSFWAQDVKENNCSDTITDFITHKKKKIRLNYYKRLNMIAEHIGKENIIVRVYEKEQYLGSDCTIVSDFLHAIGLEKSGEYQELERLPNRSLTGIYLETKRELNKLENFIRRKGYIQALLKRVADNNDDVKSISANEFMSSEESAAFLKKYKKVNAAVAREYLSRENGKLFVEEIIKTDYNKNRYETFDYIRVLAQMLEAQNEKVCELQDMLYAYRDEIHNLKLERKELLSENKKLQSTVDWVTTPFFKKVIRKLKRVFGISNKKKGEQNEHSADS